MTKNLHTRSTVTLGATALALCAVGVLGAGPAAAHDDHRGSAHHDDKVVTKRADLTALNGSGAFGKATVVVKGDEILRVKVRARGLTPDAPHAQHIHYGQQALNECPGLAQDINADGRLTTLEGVPAYGPVAVSLTTTGDTSPASVLEVGRFPSSERGRLDYRRTHVPFTDVAGAGANGGTASAAEVADAVRRGEGVVVIHGVDYDGSGKYDGDAKSDLDPSLPAEATDPATCGVLSAMGAGGADTGAGGTQGGVDTNLLAAGVLAMFGGGVLVARRRATASV